MFDAKTRVLKYLAALIVPAWILYSSKVTANTSLRALGWLFFGAGFVRHIEGEKRQGVLLMAVGVVITAMGGLLR